MSSGLTIAVVTAAVGLAAYAVYFDYKRRNDVEFRKRLKRDKKRVQKSVAQNKTADDTLEHSIPPAELKVVLNQLKGEEQPRTAEERETYFMSQVGLGEQLALQGPVFYLPSALAFFRALRVYPSPVELIVIYQKTIPEPVFKIVMDLTNTEVSDHEPDSLLDGSSGIYQDTSPTRGPPSETSSQEWDKVTDPGSHTPI